MESYGAARPPRERVARPPVVVFSVAVCAARFEALLARPQPVGPVSLASVRGRECAFSDLAWVCHQGVVKIRQ